MDIDEIITPDAFKRKVVYRCYKLNNYYIQQQTQGKVDIKDIKEKLRLVKIIIDIAKKL